ncbi:MAG: sulfite exporter TauE/SafE family protein [Planctomycetes bacterium]|nr:sulfite exporter TauE/SafE family protein [Planctomycetota bacterium]
MDPTYFAPPLFFVIALIFSMLGMGGSQLYIPVLYWMGMDFKTEAIPLGMLLNVVNSSSAAVTYAREKLIDWRVALPFGVAMVVFAPLGTFLNLKLPTRPVIIIFALFTATAAVLMLSGWKPAGGALSSSGKLALGTSAGSVLGFFAGLIGRGGGSFVVPLLYIAGLDAKVAAATSAMVVTFSGTSSFVSHLFTAARPDWLTWGLCVGAVFLGSQAGSRLMARRLKSRWVKVVFGVVLLGVAGLLIAKETILK